MLPEDARTVASAFSDLHLAVAGLRGARVAASGAACEGLRRDFLGVTTTADLIEAKAAAVDLDADAASAVEAFARVRSAPRVLTFCPASAFADFSRRLDALAASTARRARRRASAFMDGARAVIDGPGGADLLGGFVRFAAVAGVTATLSVSVGGKAEAGVFSFPPPGAADVAALGPGPSGAMQDLSADVLATNLGGMESALNVLEAADMVVRRCALGDAPRGETGCVVRRSGIVFDYNVGRYEAWLLPVDGFSNEPRLVAVEQEGELEIVDKQAYSLVRQGSLNAAARDHEAGEAPEM